MTPDHIRQLLGGYATGTLTDQEKKLLFEAALEDQELFDAMAAEDSLRELAAGGESARACAGDAGSRAEDGHGEG